MFYNYGDMITSLITAVHYYTSAPVESWVHSQPRRYPYKSIETKWNSQSTCTTKQTRTTEFPVGCQLLQQVLLKNDR